MKEHVCGGCEAKLCCVFVCFACGWMNFAVNCFPLLGSSLFEGFCVFEFSECISP